MERYMTTVFFKQMEHIVEAESPAHAIEAAMDWAMQQDACDLVSDCSVRNATPEEMAEEYGDEE